MFHRAGHGPRLVPKVNSGCCGVSRNEVQELREKIIGVPWSATGNRCEWHTVKCEFQAFVVEICIFWCSVKRLELQPDVLLRWGGLKKHKFANCFMEVADCYLQLFGSNSRLEPLTVRRYLSCQSIVRCVPCLKINVVGHILEYVSCVFPLAILLLDLTMLVFAFVSARLLTESLVSKHLMTRGWHKEVHNDQSEACFQSE